MSLLINYNTGKQIASSLSADVDCPLMVCSHERSGTHFLMNLLASCTHYTARPYLNFDIDTLASHLNFFDEGSVARFIKNASSINVENRDHAIRSILKSHFPVDLCGRAIGEYLKVLYVYRNPVDVLVSYWRFLHACSWFEGPKTETPAQLARHVPAGQSQRYQMQSYRTYFERWARHVSSARRLAEELPGLCLVRYEDLCRDHEGTLSRACARIGVDMIARPAMPPRDVNVVKGAPIAVTEQMVAELRAFCAEALPYFPDLPADIMD